MRRRFTWYVVRGARSLALFSNVLYTTGALTVFFFYGTSRS